MIEVDELGDDDRRSGTAVRSGLSRGPAVAATVGVAALLGLGALTLSGADDRTDEQAAPTTEPAPATSAPPTVDTSTLPETLRSLDLLLYGGEGASRLDLDAGSLEPHVGRDALAGRELDVLGGFDGGIVLRGGTLVDWSLRSTSELGADAQPGNVHVTQERIWLGRAGAVTSVDADGRIRNRGAGGLPQVIGSHEEELLVWRPFDGLVERLAEPTEVVAEGSPLAGGESWLALIACDLGIDVRDCDLRFVDLRTGIDWDVAGVDATTTSVVRSTGGRRAVLELGQEPGEAGVFLVDADELVTRPIALESTLGATFDPTDRFVLHPSWGVETSLLCALDLETGQRSCVDPGVDFSGVLVRPTGGP